METTEWANDEQTLIVVDIQYTQGQVSMDQRMNAVFEAMRMVSTVSHPVDIVIDLRSAKMVARGNMLEQFKRLNKEAPENLGLCVVVGSRMSRLYMLLMSTIDRIYKLRFDAKFVKTMEEAEALINKRVHSSC